MASNRFNTGPGPSQRQLRVGELIRRTLSDVLLRGDVHDPDLNRHSITVGEVRTSPTVMEKRFRSGSCTSPRSRTSDSVRRISSPTRNWRCEGPLPE